MSISIQFDQEKFAKHLHYYRWHARLSVRAFGKLMGTSASTISRIEREYAIPDVELFYRVCIWMHEDPAQYLIKLQTRKAEAIGAAT